MVTENCTLGVVEVTSIILQSNNTNLAMDNPIQVSLNDAVCMCTGYFHLTCLKHLDCRVQSVFSGVCRWNDGHRGNKGRKQILCESEFHDDVHEQGQMEPEIPVLWLAGALAFGRRDNMRAISKSNSVSQKKYIPHYSFIATQLVFLVYQIQSFKKLMLHCRSLV